MRIAGAIAASLAALALLAPPARAQGRLVQGTDIIRVEVAARPPPSASAPLPRQFTSAISFGPVSCRWLSDAEVAPPERDASSRPPDP